ncbi:hypothetical protein G9A89_013464 [Geosiphon pyriformis]|nr:hypothetical protein G9A89_013464 [Geosiphon pyriformis]
MYSDIFYLDSARDPQHTLDLYIPPINNNNNSVSRPPILVFVHGGAWYSGDKKDNSDLLEKLSTIGNIAVASVNYRLTSKENGIKNPAHVQDAAAAVKWVSQNGDKYGYQEDKIYLSGHSAGGFITAQLIFLPEYLGNLDPDISNRLRGVIGIQGVYDIPNFLRSDERYEQIVIPAFGEDESLQRAASPQYQPDSTKPKIISPPYLIIHSLDDTLVRLDQAENFYQHILDQGAATSNVQLETSLKGDHYEILKTDALIHRMVQFISNS